VAAARALVVAGDDCHRKWSIKFAGTRRSLRPASSPAATGVRVAFGPSRRAHLTVTNQPCIGGRARRRALRSRRDQWQLNGWTRRRPSRSARLGSTATQRHSDTATLASVAFAARRFGSQTPLGLVLFSDTPSPPPPHTHIRTLAAPFRAGDLSRYHWQWPNGNNDHHLYKQVLGAGPRPSAPRLMPIGTLLERLGRAPHTRSAPTATIVVVRRRRSSIKIT
jgi:hypothetical protein